LGRLHKAKSSGGNLAGVQWGSSGRTRCLFHPFACSVPARTSALGARARYECVRNATVVSATAVQIVGNSPAGPASAGRQRATRAAVLGALTMPVVNSSTESASGKRRSDKNGGQAQSK